ncbi:MAG: hypothetical protein Q4F28_10835 [Eubacteriales bacterium]|nr:hypothetical protein [Eubacteriales bacterium]
MRDNGFAVKMNRGGELLQEDLHKHTKAKYQPDSLFLRNTAAYLLMAVCIVIDLATFRSLFVRISYDTPFMILLQVAGLAFGADVVAVYAGIVAKQIRQGLSREKETLYILLGVTFFSLAVNGILRYATMSLSTVGGVVDAETIAQTIFAVVIPLITSVGNFAISYKTYDPLGQKMCREEMALEEIKDYCRRLESIQAECEDFNGERILEMDRQHLANAKKEVVNDALILYADLGKSRYDELFERLSRELEALEKTCGEHNEIKPLNSKQVVNISEAA